MMRKVGFMRARRGVIRGGVVLFGLCCLWGEVVGADEGRVFRAGAAAVDITPQEFPVRVSGSFFERATSEVKDRLHARCLVLDDGRERLAIVVIDNCVTPREVFDPAKQMASEATGIAMDRMLMSANHTHSGPALDGLLGSNGNPQYRAWLPGRIAEAVKAAVANLAPARIGWTVIQDTERTHCRRWIRRPDRIDTDPFGYRTVRAMMHPGYRNPAYLGPAGPVDPDLSILSVQTAEGQPLGLLANYSMHYVGAPPLSADYFGAFGDALARRMGDTGGRPAFVGIMSQGTSGDLHWMDYSQPKPAERRNHLEYAEDIANEVFEACKKIEYRDWVPMRMREETLSLGIRPITDEELEKARETVAKMEGRKPETLPEVYAMGLLELRGRPPVRELKLQALNIGGLGIAAIPCEVFGITGLKIKAYSPLKPTFTIELANGYDGYIPPPAQHVLGGYTTWRALSACLEVEAEPRIAEQVISLLEKVADQPRRVPAGDDFPLGAYPRAVLASKPVAYWRLNEFAGPRAADASGNGHDAAYDGGIAFYLEGPGPVDLADAKRVNRAPQCAGGRLKASLKGLSDRYSVEMWFANYLPTDVREVTGYLLGLGGGGACDQLGIGGQGPKAGRLFFANGSGGEGALFGATEIGLRAWNHLAMVREGRRVQVYLNGKAAAEISGEAQAPVPADSTEVFVGGRHDGAATFEGRVDEVAVYDRPLSAEEVARHYAAAGEADKQLSQR